MPYQTQVPAQTCRGIFLASPVPVLSYSQHLPPPCASRISSELPSCRSRKPYPKMPCQGNSSELSRDSKSDSAFNIPRAHLRLARK
eukprot:15205784-Alexandrium_andersonii.AAC.1